MANMGYCRMENTLADLRDCCQHMDDVNEESEREVRCRRDLVRLCREIADNYEDAYAEQP